MDAAQAAMLAAAATVGAAEKGKAATLEAELREIANKRKQVEKEQHGEDRKKARLTERAKGLSDTDLISMLALVFRTARCVWVCHMRLTTWAVLEEHTCRHHK